MGVVEFNVRQMHRVRTYDEIIHDDILFPKDRIQLPNRMATQLRNLPQLTRFDEIDPTSEIQEQNETMAKAKAMELAFDNMLGPGSTRAERKAQAKPHSPTYYGTSGGAGGGGPAAPPSPPAPPPPAHGPAPPPPPTNAAVPITPPTLGGGGSPPASGGGASSGPPPPTGAVPQTPSSPFFSAGWNYFGGPKHTAPVPKPAQTLDSAAASVNEAQAEIAAHNIAMMNMIAAKAKASAQKAASQATHNIQPQLLIPEIHHKAQPQPPPPTMPWPATQATQYIIHTPPVPASASKPAPPKFFPTPVPAAPAAIPQGKKQKAKSDPPAPPPQKARPSAPTPPTSSSSSSSSPTTSSSSSSTTPTSSTSTAKSKAISVASSGAPKSPPAQKAKFSRPQVKPPPPASKVQLSRAKAKEAAPAPAPPPPKAKSKEAAASSSSAAASSSSAAAPPPAKAKGKAAQYVHVPKGPPPKAHANIPMYKLDAELAAAHAKGLITDAEDLAAYKEILADVARNRTNGWAPTHGHVEKPTKLRIYRGIYQKIKDRP